MTNVTVEEFRAHVAKEEEALKKGDERMARIEEELRPIAKLYNAFMGASAVLTMLIGVLLWVYLGDREQIKQQGDALVKQGFVIEKLILKHEELERDLKKDIARIDRDIEKHHKH